MVVERQGVCVSGGGWVGVYYSAPSFFKIMIINNI